MIFKEQKIIFQILFALTAIFILLMGFSFWSGYFNTNITPKSWPFIFLVLSLASLSSLLIIHRKASDTKILEDQMKQRIEEERVKILSELSKKKEEKEQMVDDEKEIKTSVDKIIPKGKFKSLDTFGKKLFVNLAQEMELLQGILYIADAKKKSFIFSSGYAITNDKAIPGFSPGENITGQAAQTQDIIVIDEIPEDYFEVESGLGKSKPKSILIVPIVDKKKTVGLIEMSVFIAIEEKHRKILTAMNKPLAEKILLIQKS